MRTTAHADRASGYWLSGDSDRNRSLPDTECGAYCGSAKSADLTMPSGAIRTRHIDNRDTVGRVPPPLFRRAVP